ncbi:MAG: XRE family transcriptional regulator [Prevotella sp.]|nr:XRE family transcriptional regulator [Prevotella sp.]MBS5528225.1 XRE family transcriptional regulator [Prevotella sp.]
MIHIGKRIEAVLRDRERTVAWFARKLYCNRQNVYDIFKRESIDTTLLQRISVILEHNFFKDLSDNIDACGDK